MPLEQISFSLSLDDQQQLLLWARKSIQSAVQRVDLPGPDLEAQSDALTAHASSFVTLTKQGTLRGCIGGLEACQPLILDVIEHAEAAALNDYRFPQVTIAELALIKIEISVLTPSTTLNYSNPIDLSQLIRPGIDGVTLQYGLQRATFLPQVWEKVPDVDEFLGHLCQKMGAPRNIWKEKVLGASVYQVLHFGEEE